ncbi:MAG: hypothetical protein ACXVXP_12445 [Mycobacteriaceae bacterium]
MRPVHDKPAVVAPAQAGSSPPAGRQAARFGVHVLQMCAVMCVSLALLGLLVAGAAVVVGFSDPRQSAPVPWALVVTVTLAGAMVAWMRFMAMAWQPTLEMAGSTALAGAVMITAYALGIVPASGLTSGVCGLACVLMIADMLFRFRLYASHTAQHGHAA